MNYLFLKTGTWNKKNTRRVNMQMNWMGSRQIDGRVSSQMMIFPFTEVDGVDLLGAASRNGRSIRENVKLWMLLERRLCNEPIKFLWRWCWFVNCRWRSAGEVAQPAGRPIGWTANEDAHFVALGSHAQSVRGHRDTRFRRPHRHRHGQHSRSVTLLHDGPFVLNAEITSKFHYILSK